MSNYENAVSIIESRLKLVEAGDESAVVHAEATMAIEMAHSCGVIGIDEYAVFVRRFNVAYNEQADQARKKLQRFSKPVSIYIDVDSGDYSVSVSEKL